MKGIAEVFAEKKKKYRYRLFGMAGSWSEYWYWDNKKAPLLRHAIRILQGGYDAHLEDFKTGKVWTLKLKVRVEEKK